jgi:hypothetical protein
MRWAVYRLLVGKAEEMSPLGKVKERSRWIDNIKMDLLDI